MTKSAPKIKIFYSHVSVSTVEAEVNAWLEKNDESIKIIDMVINGNPKDGMAITIAYRDQYATDEVLSDYGLN